MYNKEKLLANGDMAEAEIAANLQADHVSCLVKDLEEMTTDVIVLPLITLFNSLWVRHQARSRYHGWEDYHSIDGAHALCISCHSHHINGNVILGSEHSDFMRQSPVDLTGLVRQ